MVDCRERFGAKDTDIRSIVEDSCTLLGPSLRSLEEKFRASLDKLVSDAFSAGAIGSQFHANGAVDGTKLHLLEDAASDDSDGSTIGKEVVDPPVDPDVI